MGYLNLDSLLNLSEVMESEVSQGSSIPVNSVYIHDYGV